ncbi:hypothetical protein SNA_25010 [Streptomyces natalensis ATCC 27448]|uniref:Peptide synthetase n=2 Tax=Streptomyces natalensis TaxID=68242 RepID=A0A0D7CHS0_9ACTN|nr:AMP-binding protein [Streptomyces natalensis]KIZ15728.1 hypothetical protein SNA_25010 [Streptomyces natalensis ATCC 27448]
MARTHPLVLDWLSAAAARRPEAIAVRDEWGAWTYGQLDAYSFRVARWLHARGVSRGDRVVAQLPNSRQAVALLYGALRRGSVFVPLSPDLPPYVTRGLLADAKPVLVVHDSDSEIPAAKATHESAEGVGESFLRVSVSHLFADLGSGGWRDQDDHRQEQSPQPSDTALMLYTSGSTSTPKAVVCPHAQVAFSAGAISQRLGYEADDIVYCRSPFSFDYGLYQIFLCAIAQCELALTGRQPEVALLRDASSYRATVLPLTPSLARTVIRLSRRGAVPAQIRLVTSTGEELTASTARALRSVLPGAQVVAMYGMTECKRISIGTPDADLHHPGTVGTPLAGTKVTIIDEIGRPLPAGRTGQIVVRGPHVMAGYWRAPDSSAQRYRLWPATDELALYTGDYGWLDEKGLLTVVGRRDDIFKRRGVRMSTAEIEAAALDIPGVSEAAVVAPDGSGELRMWVVSVLSGPGVLKELSKRLGPFKVPDRCTVLASIPRTVNGKADKQRLAATDNTDAL